MYCLENDLIIHNKTRLIYCMMAGCTVLYVLIAPLTYAVQLTVSLNF